MAEVRPRKTGERLGRPETKPKVKRSEFPISSSPQRITNSTPAQSAPEVKQPVPLNLPRLREPNSTGRLEFPTAKTPSSVSRLEVSSRSSSTPPQQSNVSAPEVTVKPSTPQLSSPKNRTHNTERLPTNSSHPSLGNVPLSLPYSPLLPQTPQENAPTYRTDGLSWSDPELESVISRPWFDQFPAPASQLRYGDRS